MRIIVTAIGLAALSTASVHANSVDGKKFEKSVSTSASVKVSKPFRDIAKPLPKLSKERRIKNNTTIREIPNKFPFKDKPEASVPDGFVDITAQTSFVRKAKARLEPEIGVNFDGIGNVTGTAPPDTNGDVGPNHYVQTVNVAVAVWDKQGNQLMEPVAISTLWAGFGGICEKKNSGDPIVLYDSAADRWMISQFALKAGDNHQCIAVSTTGDPTGSYYLYDFTYGKFMNDYPHFGIWNDGYYMGVNQFEGGAYRGGGVVAYERDKMLIGAEARQIKFELQDMPVQTFTPMPLDMDGVLPPPADANEYFIWSDIDTEKNIHVWEFDANWAEPHNSTFTAVANIKVPRFRVPNDVTQPNGVALDSMGSRTMYRAQYRNLDGQGKIVFNHGARAPAGQGVASLRWYELDVDQVAGTVEIVQQSTYAPDTYSRWMGSAAMDASGNIAVGYSKASEEMHPSVAASYRLATDPLNTLTEEIMLHEGTGSQAGANRWGDYSSLNVDPVDECTFWFSTEYYKAENDSSLGWSTRIASFKIPSCTAGAAGKISGTVVDSSTNEPIPYARVTAGIGSGIADADGKYTIAVPIGDYEVFASRYGWVNSTPSDITVEEDETTEIDITLSPAEAVLVSGKVTESGDLALPLYAKVTINVPHDQVITYTNPETGEYSVSLFADTPVSMSALELGLGGFLRSDTVNLVPGNEAKNSTGIDLEIAQNSNCTAPGYQWEYPSFSEGFDEVPDGWTIEDVGGEGGAWEFLADNHNFDALSPLVDGGGYISDSDLAGKDVNINTTLTSPVIDVADLSSALLQISGFTRSFTFADQTEMLINVDGAGWVSLGFFDESGGDLVTMSTYEFDLTSELDGASTVQVRIHYYDATWEYYAVVDKVQFGVTQCAPIPGTLVSGYVNDANTDKPVVNAKILIDGEFAARTFTTDDDDAINDGLFQVYVPHDATIKVSKRNFESATVDLSDITLASPLTLNTGLLDIDDTAIVANQTAGRTTSKDVSIANTGSAPADFKAVYINGDANEMINGPFHPSVRHMGPKDLGAKTAAKMRHFPEVDFKSVATPEVISWFPSKVDGGWGVSRSRTTGEFFIGDVGSTNSDFHKLWKYGSDGKITEQSGSLDFDGEWSADSAFNQRTGMLWQHNLGGDNANCIYEIDTEDMVATENKLCIPFGASQRGLAYDPVTDTFYSGSWEDGVVHQFTTKGKIIRSVNVGLAISGMAFNSGTKHLFIALNGFNGADIAILDAGQETMPMVGGIKAMTDINGDGDINGVFTENSQTGLDIDCSGNLWAMETKQQYVIGIFSGETGVCDWNNVPWLSASPDGNTVGIDESSNVTLTLDSTDMEPGDYSASIIYTGNTPYKDTVIPVTMSLSEPQFGAPQFVVSHIEVDETDNAVLSVERVGGTDFVASVDFATVNGSATAGIDYTSTVGTLEWIDGDDSIKSITVPTSSLDVHKTFVVTLSNVQGGGTMGNVAQATVTIKDVPKGGGSFGYALIMLVALAGLTRKRVNK